MRALFIASAASGSDGAQQAFQDYFEKVFPSDRDRETFVKENIETLESQGMLEVKKTDGPR